MQTKRCPKCELELPLDNFRIKRSRSNGRQPYCLVCDKKHQREHYQENKAAYKARAKEAREKAVAFVRTAKEGKPCSDCKNTYHPYVMDFDHLHDKLKSIAFMAHQGVSIATLTKEMAKCELVCANCHRMRTLTRPLGAKAICKIA